MAQVTKTHKAHVSPAKKAELEAIIKILQDAEVVALGNIQGIPAPSMLKMRRELRKEATMKVTKNTLLVLALKEAGQSKPGLAELVDKVNGPTVLITTKMNPFRLYKKLEQSKSKAPARGGEKAPDDIWVYKGDTPFKPGPVVGELQRSGIPAAIDEGKVVIKSDKLLVKKGEAIPQNIAQGLTRLEIFPLTIGLDVQAVYEKGMIYGADVLGIDEAKVLADLTKAVRAATNLSVNAGYPTKQTIEIMLQKAHREAIAVAVEAGWTEGKATDMVLGKANASAMAIARKLKDEALDEDLKTKVK
ncbi:MAG TPA: 50S ribosomal protein L10 [Candidatus Thermoplasmatota archaeon]|jgi:large subunit ribosomal protein L10|nr:50S ribosomal protein L10 [Candidatus Thermoplasmatota archaeon]